MNEHDPRRCPNDGGIHRYERDACTKCGHERGGMRPAPTALCHECLQPLMVSASGRLVCPNE